MAETEVVKVEGYNIERTSEKAILISRDNREYWIPKSQIVGFMGNPEMPDSIIIPRWLAGKKGLIPNDVDTRIACPESVEEANMLENQRKASADYQDCKADKVETREGQGDLFEEYANSRNNKDCGA